MILILEWTAEIILTFNLRGPNFQIFQQSKRSCIINIVITAEMTLNSISEGLFLKISQQSERYMAININYCNKLAEITLTFNLTGSNIHVAIKLLWQTAEITLTFNLRGYNSQNLLAIYKKGSQWIIDTVIYWQAPKPLILEDKVCKLR